MTSDDLDLSERAKENLLQNVSDMKMEVVRIGNAYKPSDKENTEVKEVKRCRFNNTGFCKYRNECRFRHSENVCENFLRDGRCEMKQSCPSRHPKTCKYWKREPKGCKRKENCKYLHRDIQPIIAKASEQSSVDNSEGDNGVEMINVDQTISDTEEIVGT